MKVSIHWLQNYFDKPLPTAEVISDAYTFHAFEIDEAAGDLLDVKVLPNRAADCLSHRGLAKELSAILNIPIKADPLRDPLPAFPTTEKLSVSIEDPQQCLRYMGALVTGVKVGSSPAWLKTALESVGQRSINNIVDATNYVMLNIGQPLHAFDANKITQQDGTYSIRARNAHEGEKMVTLSGDELSLTLATAVIADAHTDIALGIAGVKGGKRAEVTADTVNLIIEAANFDGTSTRRTAQALKLFTDASTRFQNRPSPELVAYGMRDVLAIIAEVAGGTLEGVVDEYPARPKVAPVQVSRTRINGLLGSAFTTEQIVDVFHRLDLPTGVEGDVFTVTPPLERVDLTIPENLIEEVGRIIGYDQIPATPFSKVEEKPDQSRFRGIERMKDQLVAEGFIEVSTQSFATKGDITLANPLDKAKPALRTSLEENLTEALAKAKYNAPVVLPPNVKPKLFEVGSVFPKEGEYMELRMSERVPEWGEAVGTVDNLSVANLEEYGNDYQPKRHGLSSFKPFSLYPFISRDIALWVPSGIAAADIEKSIRENAGELLLRFDKFDQFEKEGRVSYAFRLVFSSMDRTLTDEEINTRMEAISGALAASGYEVR
ncbi:MAG: phenylalanyl-tRNA synthetase subunit beta, phenylalanyl-tRNA synthetase beta chain [Parcubacteria group bacterium]|nr:phenylalanyl-tRNA synthetase subunit beta, phenylalanyl-tRNA synthetase beta chain [Parcubacteria group bacterium]